ncbi:MAG: FecR domain-containing protein [Spirochaeta sp.]|jgi:hypothetical protein|nr:FecR domain-containing protein [Spirochaeta sp.]
MNTFRPVPIGVIFAVLFAWFVPTVMAQAGTEPYAFVIYAEGYNLSVFRNDEMTTYDVLVDDVIGMPLLPGDLVQTDNDTFVEMQVMPSRTVVKIAENTTFEIERIGGAGGGTFDMSYGRMRARVERLTQNDRFEIRGFTAVAGVRGTDFGYDMVVEREAAAELQTKVYVFDGEVEVSEPGGETVTETADASGSVPEATAEPVRLQANEMVSVVSAVPPEVARRADEIAGGTPGAVAPAPAEEAAPRKVVFRQQQIETEIEDFWQRKDFAEDAIDPDTVEEKFPGINARVQRLSDERRQYEELQRRRREGLLGAPEEFLAESEEAFEAEPEREPQRVALGEAATGDRIERLLLPDQSAPQSVQLRQAGNWLVGVGVLMELGGLAGAWFIDDARSFDDIQTGGASTGAMIGGGVFIGSGLFSYLLSLVVD